jgi:D-alanine-D-alanine ligase-like ATP-grasp enzyme
MGAERVLRADTPVRYRPQRRAASRLARVAPLACRGRSRRRRNIVLAGIDSSISAIKIRAYTAAAHAMGLSVRWLPNADTVAILPVSDFRVLDAAWMCKSHGVPGPDPVVAAIAMSKSLLYQFLQNRGFEVLSWIVPIRDTDLHARLDGPVIVKPDAGSGAASRQPWGYRVFDGMRDFRRWLHLEKLTDRFLDTQVHTREQRHIVMQHVEGAQVYSAHTVAGDRGAVLYDTDVIRPMSKSSMVIARVLVGERLPDAPYAVRMASALAAAGLRRSIIYLQFVSRRGKLYPIDLNLRPGALWGQAATALGVPVNEELLAVMLGMKARPLIRWPAPYVGIVRVPTPLRSGRFRVEIGARDAVLLSGETHYDPAKPDHLGHAWPLFALTCDRPEEFDRRADAAAASIRLVRSRQPAKA